MSARRNAAHPCFCPHPPTPPHSYDDHAKEMKQLLGDDPPPEPMIFLKPPSSVVVADGGKRTTVTLPRGRGAIHYETEIVLRVSQHVTTTCDAVTLGLDLTLRDVQATAKKRGWPWETAKVFPGSAVLAAPWVDLASFPDWASVPFTFTLNGEQRQRGLGSDMSTPPAAALAAAAATVGVRPGDLLFTGTPSGVGPLTPGDVGVLEWGDRVRVEVEFV